jgi:hypothetical protein
LFRRHGGIAPVPVRRLAVAFLFSGDSDFERAVDLLREEIEEAPLEGVGGGEVGDVVEGGAEAGAGEEELACLAEVDEVPGNGPDPIPWAV